MAVLLVMIYTSFVGLGISNSILGSVWPQMQTDLGARISLVGYLSTSVTIGMVLSSLLANSFVKAFDTGRSVLIGSLLLALAMLGFVFAPWAWILFPLCLVMGFGSGVIDAVLNNLVALRFKARHMNWLHCFWGLGALLGPLLASGAIGLGGGWRDVYLLAALLEGCLCVSLFGQRRRWSRLPAPSNEKDDGKAVVPGRTIWRTKGIVLILLSFMLGNALEATPGLWNTSYLCKEFSVPEARAAMGSAVYFFSMTLGRSAAGFTDRKIGDRGRLLLGLAFCFAGSLLLCFAGSPGTALVAIALLGLGVGPVYPALLHLTPGRFGEEASQMATGLEMAFAYLGSSCFPPLFGVLAQNIGMELFPPFILVCAVLLLAVVGGSFLSEKRRAGKPVCGAA